MQYIAYPISSEAEDLIADVIAFIKTRFPAWEPNDGNLDTALIEAFAATASDVRELASQVPDTVFRYFGANIVRLPPNDATPAVTTSTWTAINTLGHLIPAGARVALRDSAGIARVFQVRFDVNIPSGSSATAAGAVQLVAIQPGAASSGLGVSLGAMELVDVFDWVSSVNQVAVTSGGVDAELDTDYLARLREYLTLLAPRPILPGDFALLARQIAGVYRAVAIDGYNPLHNLLTANEASAETDATGWTPFGNSTVASTLAAAADGVKSVSVTAVAGGNMAARAPAAVPPAAGSLTVKPGETIAGLVSIRAATVIRGCQAGLQFYDAAGALAGAAVYGSPANDSLAAFTTYSVTSIVPTGAAYVVVFAQINAAAAAEVHYVDKASIRRGTGTDWVPGGTLEQGNARMVTIIALDSTGTDVSSPIKAAIDTYMQARRELTFVVNEASPIYSSIDVTYQVKSLPGYDAVDLLARINAALSAYFNPARWGVPPSGSLTDWSQTPKVRYLEVSQIINAVDGVDYITTTGGNYDLTIRRAGDVLARLDVTLPGIAPLTTAGVMTGTIV